MQIKINVLTKIVEGRKTTFYFIHKESSIVLPLEFAHIPDSTTEDTYVRTLNALGAIIKSMHIYLYLGDKYYVYLQIQHNETVYDINTSIENALCMLDYLPKVDIYIEKEILCQEGIEITKEMLEKNLLL